MRKIELKSAKKIGKIRKKFKKTGDNFVFLC